MGRVWPRHGHRGRPLNSVVSHHVTTMKSPAPIIAVISLLLLGQAAVGADSSYECEVRRVYTLSDQSEFEPYWLEKNYKGKRFSVSRKTGEIRGAVAATSTAQTTRVVHPGNESYSFKAVAESAYQIQVIEIHEYRRGLEKPFVVHIQGDIAFLTGHCR
jgi:hypothetical protein